MFLSGFQRVNRKQEPEPSARAPAHAMPRRHHAAPDVALILRETMEDVLAAESLADVVDVVDDMEVHRAALETIGRLLSATRARLEHVVEL